MASQESTRSYFTSLSDGDLREHGHTGFGATGWRVSRIGFGGYRIDLRDATHRKALEHALASGVNLVDTSSNYTDGGSELLVGEALTALMRAGRIGREQVVLVSKAGYVQGKNLALAREREAEGAPFPDMVKHSDDCWHCIHPEFLEDQLMRTLQRLQQDVLDVYLLHNPEYFLSDAKQRGREDLDAAREEYYQRIGLAFDWLEDKAREGLIRCYGVSSNSFPAAADDPEFTSIERVLDVAESVGTGHHFRVIQFPFNLLEAGAATERNQRGGTKTLLDVAREKGLATLVNRPLNAFTGRGLVRLADFGPSSGDKDAEFERARNGLAESEGRFREEFLPSLPAALPRGHLEQVFNFSNQLSAARESFESWEHWDQAKQTAIVPQIRMILGHLNPLLRGNPGWHGWASSYLNALNDFLGAVSRHYEALAGARSRKIASRLDALAPGLAESEALSQKALRALTSTPGVDCVLLGMRKTEYVEDALAALRMPPLDNARAALEGTLERLIS